MDLSIYTRNSAVGIFKGKYYMQANITVADVFRPGEKIRAFIYDLALIVGGSLLIAASAQIKVWLPFSPVPVTGQTFAVLLTGTVLGCRRGVLCIVLYLVQGLAGLPVFAAGVAAGPAVLFGPTGGYLAGFIPAAAVTGLLAEKGWDRKFATTIAAMSFGNLSIYAFGIAWLCILTGVNKDTLTIGLYPFIVGDIFKIVLASVLLPTVWKIVKKRS
jgi:biotin transport system substrate-specific component